ncbi:MAG: tagatose-bisphosphate aldolase [Candidatus Tagabacteria bacterium CG09_land_8_20_14_0_10_41_14]|uniref:Tagatose-bisphosphate aldolase n=2 Tax=Candidatus Tagaibacteriota TaxID=1817918 RepID=A0A2H0WLJ7_9BACT|nr:MAG: tagatose-bisphosphate aldolase [Candidatus Tagabacteria bacterium CG09_land_8_20_14_0_10_41_14]PJE73085.1 MAG: tagatose-bisphosphate aldolase [Candidatus Tagabacteria bacterium CG10_big_fil_rev_8_21_14_0_10_40_13]
MQSLNNILKRATGEHWSTGHFNISNLEQLKGIVAAAKNLSSPLLIGLSEGERGFFGPRQAVEIIKVFEEETDLPIFVNPDHSKTVESAKAAFDAGFNSIHIDLSKESFEDNIKGTKEVVDYVKSKNPDISVEGELGYLRGESKIQKEIIEIKPEDLTKPEQAAEFVKKTGIDRFSGAYGNIHGIAANEPKIDIGRIAAIRKILPKNVSLVLHGGSGITDEEMKQAILAGIANVHISTEIRVAYIEALRKAVNATDEAALYKIMPAVVEAVQQKVEEKLKLFGSVNKI